MFIPTKPTPQTQPQYFFFHGALRPQKPYGLLGSGDEWDWEWQPKPISLFTTQLLSSEPSPIAQKDNIQAGRPPRTQFQTMFAYVKSNHHHHPGQTILAHVHHVFCLQQEQFMTTVGQDKNPAFHHHLSFGKQNTGTRNYRLCRSKMGGMEQKRRSYFRRRNGKKK